MKLISNLNVNGNLLVDGEKNIGPVKKEIHPINKDEITIQTLQNSLLVNGKVKQNLSFEEFIENLLQKLNPEISTKNIKLPKVSVSGELSGTTGNLILEVGAPLATYTLTNTATKKTYTDGQALTHTYTMGKSTDSETYKNIGCEDLGSSWDGDDDSNVKTVEINFTPFEHEAQEETKSMSVGNITLTESYGPSTKDLDTETIDDLELPVFRSSYGNALYSEIGEAIESGTTTASTTNQKTVTISTKFYSWVKNHPYLGGCNLVKQEEGVTLNTNDTIIVPTGYSIQVLWTTTKPDDSTWNIQNYNKTVKYIALPSQGIATLLDNIPETGAYIPVDLYTITNFPVLEKSHNLKIIIGES